MIGYQIPISLSRLEDCFGEHLEAGWLKGLHSCASVSESGGMDTRPLPGKEVEFVVVEESGVVGWTKRKFELESMRARSAEAYFSLDHTGPVGKSDGSVGGPVVSLTPSAVSSELFYHMKGSVLQEWTG